MSVSSARTVVPVLAILALLAALGWYYGRERGSAPQPGVVGQQPSSAAPAPRDPETQDRPAQNPGPTAGSGSAPQQSAALPPNSDSARASQVPLAPAAPQAEKAESQGKKTEEAAAEPKAPSFDVVRVEPSGESVIAGRAAPGATVELLRNGQPFARVVADASGLFAFVPPPLPAGSHEIVLQSNKPEGAGRIRSAQSVTVVIGNDGKQVPLVTVTAPDQPTVVLSQPDGAAPATAPRAPEIASAAPLPRAAEGGRATPPRAAEGGRAEPSASVVQGRAVEQPAPAAAPAPPAKRPEIRIATVESEGTGRLFVSGQAAPGATIRLYLNDAFVAPGGTGPEGRLSFSIERGIRPGDYRVRLDDVDPVTGAVKSRAEVPFTVPAPPPIAVAEAPVGGANSSPGGTAPSGPRPSADRAARSDNPPVAATRPAAPIGNGSGTQPEPPSRLAEPSPQRPVAGTGRVLGSPASPGLPQPGTSGRVAEASPPQQPAGRGTSLALTDPGQVVVPEVNTAIVARGDNLWRISKRVYGRGLRYTVIFGANTPQIRDPDLIYPGQLFVLPADTAQTR